MLVVHHLNDARSQRVRWLLEELGLAYEIRPYQRDAVTRLAPPELNLGYVDQALQERHWLVGDEFSAADVMMSFVGEVAGARGGRERFPARQAWVQRFQQRPAYERAPQRGGPYIVGR